MSLSEKRRTSRLQEELATIRHEQEERENQLKDEIQSLIEERKVLESKYKEKIQSYQVNLNSKDGTSTDFAPLAIPLRNGAVT
jgi:replication fork clamp-binding protein CrfC